MLPGKHDSVGELGASVPNFTVGAFVLPPETKTKGCALLLPEESSTRQRRYWDPQTPRGCHLALENDDKMHV